MKLKFKIEGLDCANCANELESRINKIEGVKTASISFMTQKMIVETDLENVDKLIEEIKKLVKKEEPDVIIKLK